MDDHVTEHLSALLDGELPELERARVEDHLKSCAACSAEREALSAAVQSLASVAPVEPSPALRRAVLAAVDAEPEGLLARLRSLLSWRLLVPAAAATAAGAALFVAAARPPEGGLAEDLAVAERLELLQDYDVVALALPADVAASDLDVVAHLDELGD